MVSRRITYEPYTNAVVLLSGGLDSTTCLADAVNGFGNDHVVALSIHYGQKHDKEVECAAKLAKYYQVKQYTLDLSRVFEYSNCALLYHSGKHVPLETYEDQLKKSEIAPTYVPFRNGLMLSAAASYAMSIFETGSIYLFIGAHSDDAAGNAYPDCSVQFIKSMDESIYIGSNHRVELIAPFMGKHKKDIVKRGLELKVPYELTWSCYNGGNIACGKCGTCRDRLAAFRANGVKDPIQYAEGIVK